MDEPNYRFNMDLRQINVIIVGHRESGKSSLTNLLIDKNVCKITDSTDYHTKLVSSHNVIFNDVYFSIIDTPSELNIIQDYLHNTKQELNVIIFLLDRRHLTESKIRRIKFFQQLFPNISQLLVITKCESEDNIGSWAKENYQILYNTFQIKDIISVASVNSDLYFIERKFSRNKLLSKLQETSNTNFILGSRLLLQGCSLSLFHITSQKYLDIGSFGLIVGTDDPKKIFSLNKECQGLKNRDQVTINLNNHTLCPTYLSRISYSNENVLWTLSIYENVDRFLSVNDLIAIEHNKQYLSIDVLGWAVLTPIPEYCWKLIL